MRSSWKAPVMRRAVPTSLSPDEHCAVHHFIRVHGRRPTPEELVREIGATPGARLSAPTGSALTDRLRRRLAGVLSRL